jgi:ABC-type phosphate transport system auxiliary subunit
MSGRVWHGVSMNNARRDIDTSEIWELVDHLRHDVDHLRVQFNGFLSGKRSLTGDVKRMHLNSALNNFDAVVQQFDKIQEQQLPALKGRVTSVMTDRVRKSVKYLESLHGALYEILFDYRSHNIPKEKHTMATGNFTLLHEALRRLSDDVGIDKSADEDTADN